MTTPAAFSNIYGLWSFKGACPDPDLPNEIKGHWGNLFFHIPTKDTPK